MFPTRKAPAVTVKLDSDRRSIVVQQTARDRREAKMQEELRVDRGGWVALRSGSDAKTDAGYKVFAHSSPIRFRIPGTSFRRADAAGAFVDDIERSQALIRRLYRFASDADKAAALGRFEQGRLVYAKIVAEGSGV